MSWYQSRQVTQLKVPSVEDKQVLPLLEMFVSAKHLFEEQIVMVNDEVGIPEAECFVYQKAPGQVLSNRTVVDLPEVNFCQT